VADHGQCLGLWSIKLANWTCGLLAGGTLVFWLAGSLTHYAPLYTLYWPLPADFAQFSVVGGTFFIVGIALAMVGTASFVVNIYATITYTPAGWEKQPAGAFLADALGITAVRNFFARRKTEHLVSLPVSLLRAVGDPHLHAGLGIRKLHASGIWAARVGLGLRVVFGLETDLLTLVRVGSHDEIRRFLRQL
jgi:hypothetical protein